MRRTWKRSLVNRGAGLSRKRAHVYRPRSEELEPRALMALFPGNPIMEPNTPFTGVGTNNAAAALNSFEAAIGGVDNGGTAAPQSTGFRTINWDAVKLDGTDFGGPPNTIVINQNKTIVIPKNRFITRGVFFGDPYAVSGDGFVDVNPNVTGLFKAFSPPNTFAMINNNTIDLSFNLPTGNNSTPVPAATRGFGAIFLNVQIPNTSSIQYFSGDRSLGTFFVPVGNQSDPEFLGELFPDAVVTRVSLTLGTDALFTFNGTTFTGSTTNNPPSTNLVVTDDFSYAEPVPFSSTPPILSGAQGVVNAQPTVAATVATAFTGVVATFSDDTATTVLPQAFTAVINWGDGHITNGSVVPTGRGGFNVMGTNTFAVAGRVPISVDVEKLDAAGTSISLTNTALVAAANTTTALTVSPSSAIVGQPVTLTATVTPAPGVVPGGLVVFQDGTAVIGTGNLDSTGTATFTTTTLTPGSHNLIATFPGSFSFNTSTSTGVTATISPNVTSQFRILRSQIRKRGGQFIQVVTVTNTSSSTIPAPFFFVLDPLPGAKFTVVNAAGTTQTQAPIGSPFVPLITGPTLSQNQSVPLTLAFKTNSAKKILYTPRILAGITQP